VPDDLAQHVLLHEEWNILDQLDWADWLAASERTASTRSADCVFPFSHMTLQVPRRAARCFGEFGLYR